MASPARRRSAIRLLAITCFGLSASVICVAWLAYVLFVASPPSPDATGPTGYLGPFVFLFALAPALGSTIVFALAICVFPRFARRQTALICVVAIATAVIALGLAPLSLRGLVTRQPAVMIPVLLLSPAVVLSVLLGLLWGLGLVSRASDHAGASG